MNSPDEHIDEQIIEEGIQFNRTALDQGEILNEDIFLVQNHPPDDPPFECGLFVEGKIHSRAGANESKEGGDFVGALLQ